MKTRPLTAADRLPQLGDVLNDSFGLGLYKVIYADPSEGLVDITFDLDANTGHFPAFEMSELNEDRYHSRADNGPITVEEPE